MSKQVEKRDFPVSQVRRYLEPGPIVLVSSKWKGKDLTLSRSHFEKSCQ